MSKKRLAGVVIVLAAALGAKPVSSWVKPDVREVKFSRILALAVTGSMQRGAWWKG